MFNYNVPPNSPLPTSWIQLPSHYLFHRCSATFSHGIDRSYPKDRQHPLFMVKKNNFRSIVWLQNTKERLWANFPQKNINVVLRKSVNLRI